MAYVPAQSPAPMIRRWISIPSPSPSPTPDQSLSLISTPQQQSSNLPIYFSPPLIAMLVIAAVALLLVTYSRLITHKLLQPLLHLHNRLRHHRRRIIHHPQSLIGDLNSPPPQSNEFDSTTYGLDESTIRAMPLTIYSEKTRLIEDFICKDCAVCLVEFEENEYVRILPYCSHSFHVECIDIWLRSHATCPLCRMGLFGVDLNYGLPSPSPSSQLQSQQPLFSPLMAERIRPSLDECLLDNLFYLDTTTTLPDQSRTNVDISSTDVVEIDQVGEENDDNETTITNRSDMILKRSYSFGFERSFVSSMTTTAATAAMTTSPSWRFHRRNGGSSFWRRGTPLTTPFAKSRVFSFRSYYNRGFSGNNSGGLLKSSSPFFFSSRRRGFTPLSESTGMRYSYSYSSCYYHHHHHRYCYYNCCTGGGTSSRRSKSFASPMMCGGGGGGGGGRLSTTVSSRMRCGDPEALLSPERFERRG